MLEPFEAGKGADDRSVTMRPSVRFGPYLDETLLAPETTGADIDALCEGAARHGAAAVCVNPMWVRRCALRLTGSHVAVAAVVGFPLGANEPAIKAAEAALALERGARELDVVAALGLMRADRWRDVERDIAAVVRETEGALVKVIIESALLSPAGIVQACQVVRDAGAGYVKTSTGFHAAGGATTAAVRLMRSTVRDEIGVKASGGIRDGATAEAMFDAGATRLGASRVAELADWVGRGPRPWRELEGALADELSERAPRS
jgi:deoxyribose-phosphate aldolase